jgi:hypothetical protein
MMLDRRQCPLLAQSGRRAVTGQHSPTVVRPAPTACVRRQCPNALLAPPLPMYHPRGWYMDVRSPQDGAPFDRADIKNRAGLVVLVVPPPLITSMDDAID